MLIVLLVGLPLVALGGLAVLAWWLRRRRSERLAEVAVRLGMGFRAKWMVGATGLPAGMVLAGTLFQRLSSNRNVVEGRVRGVEMVVFDCTVGQGKTPWRMTVYGVKGRQFASGEPGVKAGEWYVRSRARVWFARLDKVGEVEARLGDM